MNPLSTIAIGECKTIVGFKTTDESIQRKLIALGILPGIELILEQRFPSYIIKIGYTRTAIDRETAESILVE
ncbi:MAG: FeoA family protein [Geitlerinemataceae cyanobacterium]